MQRTIYYNSIVSHGLSQAAMKLALYIYIIRDESGEVVEGVLPLNYLGVPIIASRLTKIECQGLVDKMRTQIQVWSSRNIFYDGRVMLINTVIFGMASYWASIFILPKEELLVDRGSRFQKSPTYIMEDSIFTKELRRLGIKDISVWNKAKDYRPPHDCSWCWRKLCLVKDQFMQQDVDSQGAL
ncbi:hypothetical protein Cgig2_033136 [Carnegiea gigantea]|uniref:Uncharacterized protein n=1 Tax=Carnegiea gigantea TaxID=171969 RepID=A0A9Q1GMZ7_9CARY|nr:hypothetical protein Cgig2_033136 [Carnegiea gigantea]